MISDGFCLVGDFLIWNYEVKNNFLIFSIDKCGKTWYYMKGFMMIPQLLYSSLPLSLYGLGDLFLKNFRISHIAPLKTNSENSFSHLMK